MVFVGDLIWPPRSSGRIAWLGTLVLFCAAGVRMAWAADDDRDILIVANKSLPVDTVSTEEVRNFFLKKTRHWKNGVRVLPINVKPDKVLRNEFRSRVLNMTAEQETRYWQDKKIREGAMPPPEFGHALKAVFKLKGAIGYVYRSDFKANVAKVVLVIPARRSDA